MIDLTEPTRRSSPELDLTPGRALMVLKNDASARSRLGSIVLMTGYVVATVGWLWLLVEVAGWLIGLVAQ
jgi:hypothetical protein